MSDKNLLIISHNYNDFVKDQTETIAHTFSRISVCVRYNTIIKYLSYLPLQRFANFKTSRHLDVYNLPPNISVFPTDVFYWPSDAQYRKLGDLHAKKVKKTIREQNIPFDLIHSHFTWSAGYAGARLREEYGVPFVVTAHGEDIYDIPFRDEDWKNKIEYVLNTADHIITVSQSNLSCIKKLNVKKPITVMPNGFRGDLFFRRDTAECRRMLGVPQDKKIILAVGTLEPVKGHAYLISSMKEIISRRKDVLCVIVGAGELRSTLEQQIHSLGLEGYVRLVGGKPHNEIPLWISACDLFVLSSLNEGNPTVMFEALGCGKPFIGTRVGGVPEVIISDRYGLLVNPADPAELAGKILTGLDRMWDQEAIVQYADQFTWNEISKEILKVYRSVF
jgi:glycosyltransferase involved in cell wall biosynthesis